MPIRLLISVAVLILAFLVLFLVLIATETALTVWHYLRQAPLWVQVGYGFLLVGLPLLTLALFWRWLRPVRKPQRSDRTEKLDTQALQEELVASARQGIDVRAALEEMQEERRRRSSGEIYVAVFGEVSSGKSSLVRALLPEAEAGSDPRAGTTAEIRHYRWQAPSGDRVVITDLPGFNLDDDSAALEETRRAHLVIFLCDADLTASQAKQVQQLVELGKPLVLALNKADRYSREELASLLEEVRRKTGLPRKDIVAIAAGGREEIVRVIGEGIERRETRDRGPDVEALRQTVQRHLDQDPELMESLRETAVLLLVSEKLDQARDRFREQKADELVGRYARRAVVGALAAVAPGSDLVIQGVLATRLVQALCELYGVSVKEVEIESFLVHKIRAGQRAILIVDEDQVDARRFGAGVRLTRRPPWHFEHDAATRLLCRQFGTRDLAGFGCEAFPRGVAAAGALLQYVADTQKSSLPHLQAITVERREDAIIVDAATRRNLELTASLSGGREGSLLAAIDRTLTAPGGRLLERRIASPSRDLDTIRARSRGLHG